MMPPASLSALLIVLALVPGWVYLRLAERIQPPSNLSGIQQLLEVLSVGAGTTGVSLLAAVLVPHRFLPFTLDVDTLAAQGSPYLRTHVHEAAASVALVFMGALLIALLFYGLRALRTPDEFRAQGSVWVHSLGSRPAGTVPYVGLHLEDGRLLEGRLHSFTLDPEAEQRSIGLAEPIRISQADETTPHPLSNLDRVIVEASKIAFITVIHVPAHAKERWWQHNDERPTGRDAASPR
jgi:hypothetical protein